MGTQLNGSMFSFGHARLRRAGHFADSFMIRNATRAVPLVIVDEADRLALKSREHLCRIYDECGIRLIWLGMPGLEKRRARYPQLSSRIGGVHGFKPLNDDGMRFRFSNTGILLT